MAERSEESRGLGNGEGVRIVKLRDFISGGSRWTSKQAWCLVTLDKSIEPREELVPWSPSEPTIPADWIELFYRERTLEK